MNKNHILMSIFCLTFLWACESNQETVEPEEKKEIEKEEEAKPQKEEVPEGLIFDPNNIATYGLATLRLKSTDMFPDLQITYDELSGRISNVKNTRQGILGIRNADGSFTSKKYTSTTETHFSYKNWQLKKTTIIEEKTFEDQTVENDSIIEEFWYDINNRPTSIVVTYHHTKKRGVYKFTYSGDKTIKITQPDIQVLSFDWEGENIVKATTISSKDQSTIVSAQYRGFDEKISIDAMLLNITSRPFSLGKVNISSYFSQNNPTEFNYVFGENNYLRTYEYTTLENGFVTKRTIGDHLNTFNWEQNTFLLEE